MTGLTAALGAYAANFDHASPAQRQVALRGVIDAVGCLLAGRHEPVVGYVAAVLLPTSDDGPSCVLLSHRRARIEDAVLINATAAHALAMDDVAWGCHPSSMLMPALLALAESQAAGGHELLRAYVVGYEILAELVSREPDGVHASGWHPSSVLGPVAVAGAASNLLRLPAEACTRALAIASSFGGGVAANFGTQTKALHVGRAAAAGALAARLARQGMTASPDALERPNGLPTLVSPRRRVDTGAPVDTQAQRILGEGLSIKQYPLCYSTHRVIDAAIDLARDHAFGLEQVERVDVSLGEAQATMASHHRPSTPLQARYSVEFAVAAGLVARAAGYAQLEPSFIASPPVQRVIERTRLHLRDDRSGGDGVFAASDRVVVALNDGRTLDSGEVRHPRGHARRPLSDEALRDKFEQGAARGGWPDAGALFDQLLALPELRDVRTLTEAAARMDRRDGAA